MLSPKDPGEIIVITPDYSRVPLEAGETLVNVVNFTVFVINGADANPGAIIGTSPQISGAQVPFGVTGGLPGVLYGFYMLTQTSLGRRLVWADELAVENFAGSA